MKKIKNIFDVNVDSIAALFRLFPDEEACIKYLESLYWSNGKPISPFDRTSKVYKLKNGNYRCKNTGKNFTVKTNTMFAGSRISLNNWFVAIWLVTVHKPGISSYQLARDIAVTQKTAWNMLHKIRCQMYITNETPLENDVEVDETLVGGRNKNRHQNKKVPHSQGRSHKDKTPVVGMIQREGYINARATKDTTSRTLSNFIMEFVKLETNLYTDENSSYNKVGKKYSRYIVDHSKNLYSYDNITTNRIEAAWTHFKRMVIGTYRNVRCKKYMQKYVDEFVFRYNMRDVSDSDKFNGFLSCTNGRITHKQIKEAKWIELTENKQSLF